MISKQAERLLAFVKSSPILAGYSFSIYMPGQAEATDDVNRMLCGAQRVSQICRGICVPFLSAVSEEALTSEKPAFFRCPRGLYIFVIPLSADSCLVCGGVLYVNTEKKAQERILKIERLIAPFISGETAQTVDRLQPPIAPYDRRHATGMSGSVAGNMGKAGP